MRSVPLLKLENNSCSEPSNLVESFKPFGGKDYDYIPTIEK